MSNATDPAPLPESVFNPIFADLYGIQLAGIFASCALYGASALQVFIYYISKPKDKWALKILPAWLIIAETIHQFLLCVALYKIVINNFGNQGVVNVIVPELFVGTIFQGFVTFSAQLFYIYRIYAFSARLKLFPVVTLPLTTLQLGLTLANNSLALKHGDPAFLNSIIWTTYGTHAINTFLDFLFVLAMLYLLSKENILFVKHNGMAQRFTVVVVNTGFLTTVATLLTIVLLKVKPNTLIYAFFNFLISPLYCNSVMANLNSRDYIRGPPAATTSAMELQFTQNGAQKTVPGEGEQDRRGGSVSGETASQ